MSSNPMPLTALLFSFRGRVSRSTFWLAQLVAAIFLVPAWAAEGHDECYACIVGLILLWPMLAISAKRWHDRDKAAWWILLSFVPIIGHIWVLVENGFLRGTHGPNRFGPDPLQPAPQVA
jgi:uncharacterized membrane protein YhaH (DUF805 family)